MSSHAARNADFLRRLQAWAERREDVRALVIVGSVARGDARPDSDVDVVLLTTDPPAYLARTDWMAAFGEQGVVGRENYGRVTSLRTFYADGVEVEFAIAPADWAAAPFDP